MKLIFLFYMCTAGVTKQQTPVAAISVYPYVPTFTDVRVMHSAYDAMNFSDINSTAHLQNVELAYNRGKYHQSLRVMGVPDCSQK